MPFFALFLFVGGLTFTIGLTDISRHDYGGGTVGVAIAVFIGYYITRFAFALRRVLSARRAKGIDGDNSP